MRDSHLRQPWPGGLCADHVFPRPSDRHPVFMFGNFRVSRTGAEAAHAPSKSSPRPTTIDGSAIPAHPADRIAADWSAADRSANDMALEEAGAFTFGVHSA